METPTSRKVIEVIKREVINCPICKPIDIFYGDYCEECENLLYGKDVDEENNFISPDINANQ